MLPFTRGDVAHRCGFLMFAELFGDALTLDKVLLEMKASESKVEGFTDPAPQMLEACKLQHLSVLSHPPVSRHECDEGASIVHTGRVCIERCNVDRRLYCLEAFGQGAAARPSIKLPRCSCQNIPILPQYNYPNIIVVSIFFSIIPILPQCNARV